MSDSGDLLYDPTAEPKIRATGLAPRLGGHAGRAANGFAGGILPLYPCVRGLIVVPCGC